LEIQRSGAVRYPVYDVRLIGALSLLVLVVVDFVWSSSTHPAVDALEVRDGPVHLVESLLRSVVAGEDNAVANGTLVHGDEPVEG